MNKSECAKVLAKIQLGDNRQVDQLVLDDWFETIRHLDYEDAYRGVVMHRQESTDWIMPAHVVRNARRVRDDRERQERLSRPAIAAPVITLDRAALEAETAKWTEHYRRERERPDA